MRGRRFEPIGVALLVIANVAVFVSELDRNDPAYVAGLALVPYDVSHGIVLAAPSPPSPLLTLLTAQFVHAGWPHLISNAIVLGLAGPPVERALGTARFLAFYLTCGTLGAIACVAADPGSHVPIVGASGAIAGILGAFLILSPLARVGPAGILPPALFIVAWAFLQFEHGFGTIGGTTETGTGVAYFAHIGGFLAGVIGIAPFARSRSAPTGRTRP